MKRICVFCGSRDGLNPAYIRAAHELGAALADKDIGLVYGGGCRGLMGAVADAAFGSGGDVIGIIPEPLIVKEGRNDRLTQLRVVSTMTERKQMMFSLADGFIALPGGYGTISEICETIVAIQLGWFSKPCGLVNVGGFYDPFLTQISFVATEGFVPENQKDFLIVDSEARGLVDKIVSHLNSR